MRVQKPTPLSLLNGPFEVDGKVFLVMVRRGHARFHAQRRGAGADALGRSSPRRPARAGCSTRCGRRRAASALVLGSAYAPGKKPAPAVAVRASVGASQKELWAVGDRVRNSGVPSDAAPFVEMPITWEGAFGGEGSAQNPLGKGGSPVQRDTGEVHALPNIELRGQADLAAPAPRARGFGLLDPSWESRVKRAGTYDKRWLDSALPEPARRFDNPLHFNMAPEDLVDSRAEFPARRGVLVRATCTRTSSGWRRGIAAVRARLFVTRRDEEGMRDVPLRCDTLWFLPHVEQVIALFRGTIQGGGRARGGHRRRARRAREWSDRPKPLSHYAKVREDRLDKKLGPLFSLRDTDLMPEGMPVLRSEVVNHLDELLAKEGHHPKEHRAPGGEAARHAARGARRRGDSIPTSTCPRCRPTRPRRRRRTWRPTDLRSRSRPRSSPRSARRRSPRSAPR